jgi:hypothetical protein
MTAHDDEQRTRRETLENDRRVRAGQTMFGRAQADADAEYGGRFAALSKPVVVGSGPTYPQLPASSSWSHDPVPPEPPLGIDVNAVEPVGTSAEIGRSLGQLVRQGRSRA